MSNTKTIQSSALRGVMAGNLAGIIAGLIGSIFFREFWIVIAKTTTEQVADLPFWLSLVFGGLLGGIIGLVIARVIKKHIILLTALGIAIGIVLAWNNAIERLLTAILSTLNGIGGGVAMAILAFAFMLITNVLILRIPGRVFGTLIGAVFKLKKLLIICGIVSLILLLSMWGVSSLIKHGMVGSWLGGTLVGIFVGMIVTNRALTNIFENNREGGTVDRIFGDEKKVQTSEDREMEMIIVAVISFIGGIIGAILGGLGWLSF